jgi:hypothetical protein
MVFKYVANETEAPVRRVWFTSSTLLSDVHIAYHNKRKLSESEATSRKLDAILYALSSNMGVWQEEGYENIFESDGDC